jgi:hypothetical protein
MHSTDFLTDGTSGRTVTPATRDRRRHPAPEPSRTADPDAYRRLDAHKVRQLAVRTGPGPLTTLRFAVTQRIIAGTGGAAASLRAWYRRYLFAQERRDLGTARAILAVLKTPARVARTAWRDVRAFGPAARDRYGVSLLTQYRQLAWLALFRGINTDSYYRYQLFRADRRRQAHQFIQSVEIAALYRVLVVREAMDDFVVTEDKGVFERWCREHDLPTPAVLAEFEGGHPLSAGGAALPDRDLFSKLADGYGGAGARRWTMVAPGLWTADDGVVRDRHSLFMALARQSEGGRVILQERVENHPALRGFSSGALCTARILTSRAPDGAPELARAAFRMPVGDSSTDNYSQGGIAAAVDEHGRLGTAVQAHERLIGVEVLAHPDSGVAFAGFQLPEWSAAAALAIRAHSQLTRIACVGWDVALTIEGPVLIEGNFAPGVKSMQMPFAAPLSATNYLAHIDAHLRRSFARAR